MADQKKPQGNDGGGIVQHIVEKAAEFIGSGSGLAQNAGRALGNRGKQLNDAIDQAVDGSVTRGHKGG